MNRSNRVSLFGITAIAALGLVTAMGFNSCSDVEFSNESGPSVAVCEGADCPVPPKLQNYEDIFSVEPRAPKADILLILDSSDSMNPELRELADKLDGLIGVLDRGGIDWRMCYLATDNADSGRVLPWKTKVGTQVVSTGQMVLTPGVPNKDLLFHTSMDNLPKTAYRGNERGLLSIRGALSNSLNSECFRGDAVLSVVVISDEDQKSCGGRCKDATSSENPTGPQYRTATDYSAQYKELTLEDSPENLITYVESLRPSLPFVVNAIVIRKDDRTCYNTQDSQYPAFFGLTYQSLQQKTGGILGDICAADYSTQLQKMGERTLEATLNSVVLQCPPVVKPVVTITPPAPGVTWSLSGNKILFSSALYDGTVVKVNYVCAVPE